MNTPLRWGILGTGTIATLFAEDLSLASNATLQAIGSRTDARAHAFAETHSIPEAHGSYEAVINADTVDVIYVATPHTLHAKQALQCIDAGVPVLVEKPFTLTATEAKRVAEAARTADVFVMEAMWTRFLPAVKRALDLLRMDVVGPIQTIRTDISAYRAFDRDHRLFDPELGGGALLDLGVYAVWWSHQILGEPQTVEAEVQRAPSGVEDDVSATLRYSKNRRADLTMSFRETGTQITHVEGPSHRLRIHAPWWHPEGITYPRPDGTEATESYPYTGHGYHYEIAHVGQCIRSGRSESDQLPLDQSVGVMRTLEALRNAAGLPAWSTV